MASAPSVRVTGVRAPNGKPDLIEIEVRDGTGRLRFAQGQGPFVNSRLGAFVIDDEPIVVTVQSPNEDDEDGALVLPQSTGAPLPMVPAHDGSVFDEASALTLAPILGELIDGLYTLTLSDRGPLHHARTGWTPDVAGLVDVEIASRKGAAVIAELGGGAAVILAGRERAKTVPPAWLLRADVILAMADFEARVHDRGAREAFARSPRGVLDDAAMRDAVAHLRAIDPQVDVGPFTEDRIEPAAQQARALAWDLRAEDAIENVSDPWRERAGAATEFRARVKVKSVTFEVAFTSHDGRHVDEVIVRSGNRFRATGLRPAARGLARTLRQLADEGA